MRKFTLLIALMALCVSAWATSVTWDLTALSGVNISALQYDYSADETIDGITATVYSPENDDYSHFTWNSGLSTSSIRIVKNGTLTFAPTSGKLAGVVISCDPYGPSSMDVAHLNLGTDWSWDNNTKKLTWSGDATSSVVLAGDGTSNDSYLGNITSIVFTYASEGSAPVTTTVTWSESQVNSISLSCSNVDDSQTSSSIDDITLTITKTSSVSGDDHCELNNDNLWITNGCGVATFTSTIGNITGIVITSNQVYTCNNSDLSAGWTYNDVSRTLTWDGTPSNEVTLSSTSTIDLMVSSIEFTVETAAPVDPTPAATTITWNTADLATIDIIEYTNIDCGGSPCSWNEGTKVATIKGVSATVSATADGSEAQVNTYNDNTNIRLHGGGTLTFSTELGKFESIVINTNYQYYLTVPGWIWNNTEHTLTWANATNPASSVVMDSDGEEYGISFDNITSIVFTFADATPASDADVTWDASDLETADLLIYNGIAEEVHQTIDGITVTAMAPAQNDYCHFMSYNGETSISITGNGSLTFSPAEGELTRIVIYGTVNTSSTNLPAESGWSYTASKLIWTGDASFSVDLANASIDHITYVAFTIDDSDPSDTREVPELKFYDNLTEATIIHDSFGWDFEPGTTSNPRYGYTISVKDGVYYYQDQPYDYWKAPSELEEPLPITYSLSNNDVIELTKTEGDEFSFNVLDRGDVVVTASTIGNTRFQPASITFTIHVIDGQAPTKECVLKWVSGPNAGQLVPADFEFNLQTGDEVEWESMQLYEKDYPDYVYAPSTAIWGSRDYHVASLNGELKLRALMAGDDVFTVQYSRYHYPEGFDNGNFRTIEIPVHIKPSQPALVSDVDFSSSPLEDPNVLFNTSNYDPVAHKAQLAGTLTTQEVLDVLHTNNYNSQGWKDNLPQTISFELAAGKGSFEVNCSVQPGYEVRIIKGGDTKANDIITSSTPQPYVVNYDVTDQTPVVIFVAVAGSSNPAPKRAPAAKQDAPIASFSALAVTPTYPIAAKADPDNAGVYYSTHFNETQKYQLPVGTEAYVATISGEDMNLTKVADGGQVIPANTALILKSTSASVTLTPTDAAAVTISAPNQLQGTDSEKAAPANCYVLSGHSTDYSVTGVGFYAFSGTLPAHKAYLIYGGGAGAPQRMRFIFSGEQSTTGINNANDAVKSEKRIENGQFIIIKNGVRYNAQGQLIK